MAFDPDKYLAEKEQGGFDPDAYLAAKGVNADDEDPGMLKSAAAGLMSGVPLAETAIAGVKSAIGDKTYAEEHKALEDLKDKAWDKHPVAYGAGKVGGLAGTSLVAPETLVGRLGLAAAQGAGFGVDEAADVKDIPLDALKGAGMGVAVGGIGEGIGAAVKKLAPAIGKGALAALLPRNGKEAVEARLASPSALDEAIGPVAASEKLAGGLNSLRDKADELGAGARELLNPEKAVLETPGKSFVPGRGSVISGEAKGLDEALVSPFEKPAPQPNSMLGAADGAFNPGGKAAETVHFPSTLEEGALNPATGLRGPGSGTPGGDVVVTPGKESVEALRSPSKTIVTPGGSTSNVLGVMQPVDANTLKPVFNNLKARFSQNGIATSPANEAALTALDAQYGRLLQIAQHNGGQISEPQLKQIIVDMQKMLSKNVFDNPDVGATKEALKQLSGALNGMLKEGNPSYAEAMVPDAKLRGVISEMKDTFKPDINEAGDFINSDSTNSKLSTILNENKSNAQEALDKFGDLTGFDFLKNAKNYDLAQAFETGKGSSEVKNALTLLGYGAGHMAFPFPGGGILGAAAGRIAGAHVDGGQIAKKIIDRYLSGMQTIEDSGLKAAYQKYGPLLINAAKTGGNNLAATHFVLATSHPEYQQMMHDADKE